MTSRNWLCLAFILGGTSFLSAAIIGTNVPALPLTTERIAALPIEQQPAWREYLRRSEQQMQADKQFLLAEMQEHGLKQSTNAPYGKNFSNLPLDESAAWYGKSRARHIADIIVSFQTPAGGWSKRIDMTHYIRVPGERFTSDNTSHFLSNADYDLPHNTNWSYVGTFDNDTTTTQLRFLAKVIAAVPAHQGVAYRVSFLHGLDYIFDSQQPNGGWPQVWPLQGGYHDAITFNDAAMVHVLELLRDASGGRNEFAFVPEAARVRAAESLRRGIECVLKTQIVGQGRRTVWCQQNDALTLQPTSARNYEMPCQSGRETFGLVKFLMQLPDPSPEVCTAVRDAVAWLEKTQIRGYVFKMTGLKGRLLIPVPGGSAPIWARYYEIGTDRPIFGERDKTIHDTVTEISKERRKGYTWYEDSGREVLRDYARWSKQHPQ